MNLAALLPVLWHALAPQFFPFPRPPIPFTAARTIVQGCTNISSTGASSLTCTFSSSVTAGNSVYVCASESFSTGGSTFTGQTFTTDPGGGTPIAHVSWSFSGKVDCAYVLSASSGTTVTATVSGSGVSTVINIIALELHGGSTLTLSASDNGSGTTTGTVVYSPGITSATNSLNLDVCLSYNGSVYVGSGWTSTGYSTGYIDMGYAISSGSAVSGVCNSGLGSQNLWAHAIGFY